MSRKILSVAMLVAVCSMLCLQVYANTGTIRVRTGKGETVNLYRVGVLEREHYRLTDEHGGGTVTFDDILMPELAAWLAARSTGGISRETRDGIAEFSGLSEGLYLAEGDFAPFLISLPWDGDTWYLEVKPEREEIATDIPQTGDRGAVVISSWIMAAAMLGMLVIGSRKKY